MVSELEKYIIENGELFTRVSKTKEISSLGRVRKNGVIQVYKPDSKGYIQIRVGGEKRRLHHIVWELYGDGTIIRFPDRTIDHKDRNKLNNAISNLEIKSNRDNCKNRDCNREIIGIYKQGEKYGAQIFFKKKYNLGICESMEIAKGRYEDACSAIFNNCFEEWYEKLKRRNNYG